VPVSPAGVASPLRDVAVVAIGRNEGDRLRRCFDAIPPEVRRIVYVDSASTDDSVAQARSRGIDVVRLDMSIPFTAARARNAGLEWLRAHEPDLEFVQVLDGDCALAAGWMEAALEELRRAPRLAVVCGRRRETRPEASPYNRLCDLEWNTPVGEAASCGGDALARTAALAEVGGYDGDLIAGEEPELCARLRARGWTIRRIDHDMTFHDAAMTRFGQWWRRAQRAGHAYAEVSAIHAGLWRREVRSSLAWGLAFPAVAVGAGVLTHGIGLLLLAAYPVQWVRILLRRRSARGDSLRDGALYAAFCLLAKVPESTGALKHWWNRRGGRRTRLIEYK
jgi:glycosyltransferase involved in cell wall biosynthesis